MNIISKLKPSELIASARATICRFPIAFGASMALTLYQILFVHRIVDDFYLEFESIGMPKLTYFLLTIIPISVMLKLLAEQITGGVKAILLRIVPLVVWALVVFFLIEPKYDYDASPALLSGPLFMVVVPAAIIFFRSENDILYWKFCTRMLGALFQGLVVATVLYVGVMLFLWALQELFGLNYNRYAVEDFAIVSYFGLLPLVVMSQVAPPKDIVDSCINPLPEFAEKVVHYLLLGLLTLYIAILYVYVLKILFMLDLPDGGVSVLVSICMGGMLLILSAVYPSRKLAWNRIDTILYKVLPVLMLPLVVLMTIGIAKRFADYGVTAPRLWLVVVNAWFYAMCIYFIVSKRKRIIWIPVSFAVLSIAFSFGPWRIYNIAFGFLKDDIEQYAKEHGLSLPLEKTKDESINSKLRILRYSYPDTATSALVVKEYNLDPEVENRRYLYYCGRIEDVPIGRNVEYICEIDSDDATLTIGDGDACTLSFVHKDKTLEFAISMSQLEVRDFRPITLANNNTMLIISTFKAQLDDSKQAQSYTARINGILLTW